jgi:hypothetical protein
VGLRINDALRADRRSTCAWLVWQMTTRDWRHKDQYAVRQLHHNILKSLPQFRYNCSQ